MFSYRTGAALCDDSGLSLTLKGDSVKAKAGYQPLRSCLGSCTTFGQGNFFTFLLS